MSTKTKYIVAVVAVLIVIIIIYYVYTSGTTTTTTTTTVAAGNQYASAATINAIKAGGYGTFGTYTVDPQDFWNQMMQTWGSDPLNVNNTGQPLESYVKGWFRGMNIDLRGTSVQKFQADIDAYIHNTSLVQNWGNVTTGSYL